MKPGSTTFAASKTCCAVNRSIAIPRCSRIAPCTQRQNGMPRPTWFSHSRLWLSWIDRLTASPIGVDTHAGSSPCSYMPWPVSCIELPSPSSTQFGE